MSPLLEINLLRTISQIFSELLNVCALLKACSFITIRKVLQIRQQEFVQYLHLTSQLTLPARSFSSSIK